MALHRYGVPCHLSKLCTISSSRRTSAGNVQVAWLVSKCPLALLWWCLFTRLRAKANFNISVFGCLVFCNLVVGFFQGADLLLVVVVRCEDDATTSCDISVWGLPWSKRLWILGSCYVVRALAQHRCRHHSSAITMWLHGFLTRSLCSSRSKLLVKGAVSIDLREPAVVLGWRRALRAFCGGVLGLQAEPGLIVHALAHLRRSLCTLCILLLHALNLGYRLALRIVLSVVATRLITTFVMN